MTRMTGCAKDIIQLDSELLGMRGNARPARRQSVVPRTLQPKP